MRIVTEIELPELEELQKAIETHKQITKQLEENATKMQELQMKANMKLKESR